MQRGACQDACCCDVSKDKNTFELTSHLPWASVGIHCLTNKFFFLVRLDGIFSKNCVTNMVNFRVRSTEIDKLLMSRLVMSYTLLCNATSPLRNSDVARWIRQY